MFQPSPSRFPGVLCPALALCSGRIGLLQTVRLSVLVWLSLGAPLGALPARAARTPSSPRPDRILVQPQAGFVAADLRALHGACRGEVVRTFPRLGGLQVVRVPIETGETVDGLLARYRASAAVAFAEPDHAIHASALPDDPRFLDGTQWALHNTGQGGGTADADIDAPEAWDLLTSASNVVVAVLDTGVRWSHEDLAANMWTDLPGGSHGYNAFTMADDPMDDQGHGTLISGILGAVGNNGKGLAGVAWRVQIMACKCLDNAGNGYDSELIECIDYAVSHGARILNLSLDSPTYSHAVFNALEGARAAGVIVVASAGNEAVNVDVNPRYPACYSLDNIVSVAYTTRTDTLGTFSNYGLTNVDLAAPGAGMYSTFFTSDSAYLGSPSLQGTSFAAPMVAGTLALLLARYPEDPPARIIRRLLEGVDRIPALQGRCGTGGRLNVRQALSPLLRLSSLPGAANGLPWWRLQAGPDRLCIIEGTSDLTRWTPVLTNRTGGDGAFDFTDPVFATPVSATPGPARYFRAVSAP